eukprot:gb/GEZN01000473.1/.p1 GENE.gb/GEZN01000473.1/~~gb/GEZN01000473.1/.p1  ORF type:complete len:1372 (-),score=369.19 gb/GEZN01000473.1/:171-4286(-)
MTSLKKLAIQGIRSYGPNQAEVVDFFHPLTIIQGKNGSGKTTIIEALKYITTGGQPPLSDKGKSFVHDPKMAGHAVTKAQIKLSFSSDTRNFLAIRSFQCTQKKKNMEFKNLESVLKTTTDEETVSISHRCADMEKQVPNYMGVSKAVLENVIFCHQEDSNWPLSDSKTLKLKFDEIFEASRYTKALETIRKLRTEQSKQIREMEGKLAVLEVQQKSARQFRDELEDTKAKILDKSNKIKDIDEKLQQYRSELKELKAKDAQTAEIRQKVRELMIRESQMNKDIEAAYDELETEYEETDEELMAYFHKFQKDLQEKERGLRETEEKVRAQQHTYRNLVERCQKVERAMGQAEAQAAEYQDQQKYLASLLTRLAEDYKISAAQGIVDPVAAAMACVEPMEKAVEARRTECKESKQNGKRLEELLNQAITAIASKEAQLFQQIKTIKAEYSKNKGIYNSKIEDYKQLEEKLGKNQDIQEQIQAAKAELNEFEIKDQTNRLNQEIRDANGHIRAEGSTITLLATEKNKLGAQRELMTKLKILRDNLQREQLSLKQSLDQAQLTLLPLQQAVSSSSSSSSSSSASAPLSLPQPLPDGGDVKSLSSRLASDLQSLKTTEQSLKLRKEHGKKAVGKETAKLMELQNSQSSVDGQLREVKSRLEEIDGNEDGITNRFRQAGLLDLLKPAAIGKPEQEREDEEGDTVPTTLPEFIEYKRRKLQNLKESFSDKDAATRLYTRFMSIADNKDKSKVKCPLCTRHMNDQEYKQFKENGQKRISQFKKSTNEVAYRADVAMKEEELKVLNQLVPHWTEYKRCEQIKPSLRTRQDTLKQQHKAVTDQMAAQEKVVREAENLHTQICQAESSIVVCLEKANRLLDLFKDVKEREDRLTSVKGGRTLEQVEKELSTHEEKKERLLRSVQDMQDLVQKNQLAKQTIQNKVNHLQNQGVELSKTTLRMEQIKTELEDIKKNQASLKAEHNTVEKLRMEESKKKQPKIEEREQMLKTNEEVERKLQAILQEAEADLQNLRSRTERVQSLRDKAAQVQAMSKEIAKQLQERDAARVSLEGLQKEQEDQQKVIATKRPMEMDIKANISLREKKQALKEQQAKIEKQREILKKHGVADTGKMSDVEGDIHKLEQDRSHLSGNIQTEGEQANHILAQLQTEDYNKIDQRVRAQMIKCKTTAMAAKDLEVYYSALDKALMKYHSIKMQEINEALKKYWSETYKGKDIDEIYIASDAAGGDATASRRQYNYRVVMKQGDVELNMRGRCSAGQKVLASLLIRIALANTFCLKCGVLALDEPTTNLDKANIKAFAKALTEIIDKRRAQRNFQLIVITHDEQFVEELGNRAHADHYYRVSKDLMTQLSQIRKHAFNTL